MNAAKFDHDTGQISLLARRFGLISCMLLLHVAILVHGAAIHFPNVDEIAHLPAGVSHWVHGEFDLYRVSPPLVDLVSGLPALYLRNEYDWRYYTEEPGVRPEFKIGIERLKRQGLETVDDFWYPRLACIPFSVVGCVVLSWLCHRFFGIVSAHLACGYWCFCPNVLAHAQTIIPDVGAMVMTLLVALAFFRYLKEPSVGSAIGAGLFFGLLLLSKLTWIIGFLVYPTAVALCLAFRKRWYPYRPLSKRIIDLAVCHGVALLCLNAGYLFEGSFTPLGEFRFCSESLGGSGASTRDPSNRFADGPLAAIPIPLPANYLQGIDYLKHEVEDKYWSFLLGEWRKGSWWYYYLFSTAVKTPIPTLLAAFLGILVFRKNWNAEAVSFFVLLAFPALVAFFSISYQGGFNHHHRYVLFIYPPMFFAAASLGAIHQSNRMIPMASAVLCVSAALTSLSNWPHFLSFFNASVGGPRYGWKVLGYSNVDWGQDLLLVKEWVEAHPTARPCAIQADYFSVNEEFFGLKQRRVPRLLLKSNVGDQIKRAESSEVLLKHLLPEEGWYIINVRYLFDLPGYRGFGYFRFLEPVDRIGNSFHIYWIDEDALQRIADVIYWESPG